MPSRSFKTLLLTVCAALVLAGCPDKKPKGGGSGAKSGGSPPPQAQPKQAKPSKKGAQDDLQADAKQNGDNRLNDGEERAREERERLRDGLSQTPPTDAGGATPPATQQTTKTDPRFGQVPRTTAGSDPNLPSLVGAAGASGAAALPGLPQSTPTAPATTSAGNPQPTQPRGVRSKKTH
ncbi:MAG: hypothetical protein KDD51_11120 [Bdellovibrionales bacterium]|nr:hypothetical protein [Bdellovibrionales bacterium]